MKKKIFMFLILFTLVFTSGIALGAGINVKIFVDGIETKTEAKVENGITYVPLRAVSEMLGANVEWVQATNSVMITSKPKDIITQQPNTNLKQTIKNVTIEVTEVVQDSDSLRVYVKYINNSSKKALTGDSLTKLVHGGTQYKYDTDFNFPRYYKTGVKKAQSSIEPGVTEESVIFFAPLNIKNGDLVNLVLDANFENYNFNNVKVTVK